MKTGATGSSNVPGRLMPMSACLRSRPGPLTTQPITATRSSSTPGCASRHSGIAVPQVRLDVAGPSPGRTSSRPAAAGAGRDLRQEGAQAQRLEDLLGDLDLLARGRRRARASARRGSCRRSPRRAGSRGRPSRRRSPSSPCRPRSGPGGAGSRSGRPGAGRRRPGRARRDTLALTMIRSWRSPVSSASSAERSADSSIASIITSRASRGAASARVRVHQLGQERLVERAPVDADPDRLVVLDRDPDDRLRSSRRGAWRRRCPG